MSTVIFVFLLGMQGALAVIHSLKYFYTASSGIPNLPEYVSVGLVDDIQISHCDSYSNASVPKQDWMNKVTEYDPHYWTDQSKNCVGHQLSFKDSFRNADKRFNRSGGVHILQRMYGCEWDDESKAVKGYEQVGYDGEDFISLDLRTLTWVAPKPQALMTKHKWDREKDYLQYEKNYLAELCVDWLKKYVHFGRSSLLRTDLPSVSLLQKSPSSPVSCHATGFYPNKATLLWRKDGEELYEDVEQGEILPNHDGSFQMRVDLDLSSVKPEDWRRYDCVFQLSGVKEDIITKLDKAVIRTNWGEKIIVKEVKSSNTTIHIIVAVVALVVIFISITGFIIYKKKKVPDNDPEVTEARKKLRQET